MRRKNNTILFAIKAILEKEPDLAKAPITRREWMEKISRNEVSLTFERGTDKQSLSNALKRLGISFKKEKPGRKPRTEITHSEQLSPRIKEVIGCLKTGNTYAEVAHKLGVSKQYVGYLALRHGPSLGFTPRPRSYRPLSARPPKKKGLPQRILPLLREMFKRWSPL